MTLNLFEKLRLKRLKKGLLVWLLSISVLYAAVCTPIYHVLNSNILIISDTPFPLMLDVFMDLLNQLYYWGSFAVIIYTAFRFGLVRCRLMIAIYAATVLFRHVANLMVGYIMTGFSQIFDFFKEEFVYLLFNIVLDIALVGIVYWVLYMICKKIKIGNEECTQQLLPISKLFAMSNPMQKAVFFASLIPAVARLISRIIFDVFYGAPTDLVDMLWMVVYYLSDMIGLLIGVLVITLILNRLFMREMLAKAQDLPLFSEE